MRRSIYLRKIIKGNVMKGSEIDVAIIVGLPSSLLVLGVVSLICVKCCNSLKLIIENYE